MADREFIGNVVVAVGAIVSIGIWYHRIIVTYIFTSEAHTMADRSGAYIVYSHKKHDHEYSYVMMITPYNRSFVDDIKRIPPRSREFDPDFASWTVFDPYVERAKDLVYAYFSPVVILYDAPVQQQQQRNEPPPRNESPDNDHRLLGLLPNASEKLIRAAYRVRVQEVHPDTATNPQYKDGKAFMQLRVAYERLLDKIGVKV